MPGVRGIGMSDPPLLSSRLAEKFDYTNTFYHQAPYLDITNLTDAAELGRYDFIVSSEVMEHVPPPIESAFANLCRLLKPNGLLLLTVPYTIDRPLQEHFPALNNFALASPGGKTVLVNRTADGKLEVFDDLSFHGGDGSTLELRVFSEDALKSILTTAGFNEAEVASQSIPEFGVDHSETWSLPIIARKSHFQLSVREIMTSYEAITKSKAAVENNLQNLTADYRRYTAFHEADHAQHEADRTALEHQLAERMARIGTLEQDAQAHIERAGQFQARIDSLEQELTTRLEWVHNIQQESDDCALSLRQEQERSVAYAQQANELHQTKTALENRRWVRLGRKLGLL
jgi:SAM-dependent methyltransferase